MMISTFLYFYNRTGSKEYRQIAGRSLDFMQENMVGEEGASYYFDYEKQEAFLTGLSISNTWGLLAFVEGYEILNDERYLQTARGIADYSLAELYDGDAGGFFERHSKDTGFYAPNEHIDLSKPFEENAVFAYGMLRLYLLTGDPAYLEAGIKTLGYLSGRSGGLDESYYFLESARVVRDNGLLSLYRARQAELEQLSTDRGWDSWLGEVLARQERGVPIDDAPRLQSEFAGAGFLVLAVLALAAGVLSFLSPCCLPVLSAYFAHHFNADRGEMLKNTILFLLGLATVFSIFGMGATLAGSLLRENRAAFTRVAGVAIIGFGLLEILGKGFSGWRVSLRERGSRTPLGSFLFGAVFAVGWSACIGPILASLLLLSATSGTLIKGSGLLFIYAMGLGIPLILVSLYFERIKDRGLWKALRGRTFHLSVCRREFDIHTTSLISGMVLVVLGVLVFNDYLSRLNQFALQTDYVQNIIIRGEELLRRALL